MSKIYFFRHAQASFGANNYDQLSEKGLQQSVELGQYLTKKKIYFNKVFIGELQRQKDTFEKVEMVYQQQGLSLPMPISLNQLNEHAGPEAMKKGISKLMEFDSKIKTLMEQAKSEPKYIKKYTMLAFQYFMEEWASGNIDIPGLETWFDFRIRVRNGLDLILQQIGRGEIIAVFTSGGVIAAITAEALGLNNEKKVSQINFSLRNVSFSTFFYSKNQFNLLSFNELPELKKEMISFV